MADRLRLLPSSVNGRGAAAATITFADPARTMLQSGSSIRMDVITALSELGLSSLPSAGELKRAYLKAVRQHPPERDPEGFVRVREAYEMLQALGTTPLFVELHEARSPVQPDAPEPSDGTVAAEDDGARNASAPDSADVVHSDSTVALRLPDENASAEELTQRVVELLLSDNATFDAVQWILSRLDAIAGAAAVVEALKLAESKGSRRALVLLLEGSPDAVDQGMLQRAERSADERTRIATIRYYWQQNDAPETARLLTRVYESSAAEPAAIPAPSFCLDVVLRCNALGKHVAATALLNAFEQWQKLHADSKDLQGNVAARWQVARELRSLKRCASPELRQAIAEAVLSDKASLLAEHAASRRNVLSERELEQFRLFAPALYAFARPYLVFPVRTGPPPAYRDRRKQTLFIAPVIAAAISAINLLSGNLNRHSDATVPNQVHMELPQGAKENHGANRYIVPANLNPGAEATDPAGLAEAAKGVGYLSLATRTSTIWGKIQDGECKASPQELDEFLRAAQLAARAKPELQNPVGTFIGYLESACNSQQSSGTR